MYKRFLGVTLLMCLTVFIIVPNVGAQQKKCQTLDGVKEKSKEINIKKETVQLGVQNDVLSEEKASLSQMGQQERDSRKAQQHGQKQSEEIQEMSNVGKVKKDEAMATIRKIK